MESVGNRNLKLLNILSFLNSFVTFDAVLAIYFSQITGSYATAMFTLSLLHLSSAVFEIPTGLFSDKIGRKRTLLLHYAGGAVATGLYFLANSAIPLFAGAIVLGFALALSSGAIQAYVYENLTLLNKQADFKKYEGTRRSTEKLAYVMAAIAGTFIIRFTDIRTALLPTVATRTIAFIIGLRLQNVAENNKISGNVYAQIKTAWKYFQTNPCIRNIGLAQIISHGGGNVEQRFRSLFYKTLIPDWLISSLSITSNLTSAVVMKGADRVVSCFGLMRPLVLGEFINRLFTGVMIFTRSVYTPFAMAVVGSTAYGIKDVIGGDLLQTNYSPSQRATMGSLIGLGTSLFYSILGVLVGLIADRFGIHATLLLLQLILLSSIFFYQKGVTHHFRTASTAHIH